MAEPKDTTAAAPDESKVKVKLTYPHSIGDRIDIFGAVFERDGEHHYASVSPDLAAQIIEQGGGEVVEGG